jgi:cation transport ATPase
MERIAERKPPLELLADRFMNYYGPVVFVVAGLAFAGWGLVTGDLTQATLVLLTTIIMGYPCALRHHDPDARGDRRRQGNFHRALSQGKRSLS